MRKFVIFIIMAFCSTSYVEAQTFLDHLQQDKNGKAKVVVTQSKEIDELVNGNNKTAQSPALKPAARGESSVNNAVPKSVSAPLSERKVEKPAAARNTVEPNSHADIKKRIEEKVGHSDSEVSTPTVDMRKKVMRGSRKVTGYRVQAFAGGNTRNDKRRATNIGNAIKMKFPELPVYVHFYSPRWICRVGNFRSYQEAQQVLKRVKSMGYRAATIVSGKITVQY